MRGRQLLLPVVLLLACAAVYFLSDSGARLTRVAGEDIAVPAMVGDVSGPLSGLTIIVDPGHGGYDQGCDVDGIYEAQVNLDISLLLRERLEKYGAYIEMTREADVSLVDPDASGNRKKQDMALRKQVADDAGANMFISIHMNYHSNSRYSGAQIFYKQDGVEGEALATAIQASMRTLDPNNTRKASVGDYYVLGICEAAALVECGFLSNSAERAKLTTPEYQAEVAAAVAEGIVTYWNQLVFD